MTATTPQDLLPCPFCGHEPEFCDNTYSVWYMCSNCGVQAPENATQVGASSNWNARATPQPVAPTVPANQEPIGFVSEYALGRLKDFGEAALTTSKIKKGRYNVAVYATPQAVQTAEQAEMSDALEVCRKLVKWCDENKPAGESLYFVAEARALLAAERKL